MRISLCLLLILSIQTAFGQQFSIYSDAFIALDNNLPLFFPAYFNSDSKLDISSVYKTRLGPFTKITTYAITAERKLGKEDGNKHLLRGNFQNEKEGPYISRPRGYLNYAYKLRAGEHIKIGVGAMAGIAGVSFTAPTSSGSATGQVLDGGIGGNLEIKEFTLGGSMLQLFNNVAVPLGGEFLYRNYFNTFILWRHELSPDFTFKPSYFGQYYKDYPYKHTVTLEIHYREWLNMGSGYQWERGIFGFTKLALHVGNDVLGVGGSYYQPAGKDIFKSAGIIEFFVQYSFL